MKFGKKTIALIGAVAMLSSVAACGSTSAGDSGSTGSSDKKIELTVWSWDSTLPRTVKGFEAKNPNIKVKVTNAGTNKDEYNALSNAIEAGSGAPDIAQIEYYALPEYVIRGHLENLSDLGASDFKDFYTPGTWSSVNINDGVHALPMDSGPMAWFYNKGVFDKAGVDPTQVRTWDDFYEAAKKIRATGSYITNLAGTSNDYQPFTAQIWQAGAQPWKVDGENITINMTKDEGMQRYIQFVQKLIDEDLVDAKTPNWSDDWNRELNDGTLASLTIGAWMPINLMTGAPDQAGNWRVAQLPQWEEGKEVSAEDGGSALAVTSQSKNQAAAYKLVEYMTHGEGAQTMADTGTFPSLKKILRSDSFTDPTTESNKKTNDYFGGQNVNEVLSAAAQRPTEKFQYLPYNPYAQTAYGDEVSKAYSGDITLEKALENYANKLAEQGKQQGYNVTVK